MQDDEILKLYLLGALDEEQVDEIEDRLLQDGELFELAEAVEGDLLLAAARGSLSRKDQEQTLQRLAATPQGRARFAFVGELTRFRTPAKVLIFRLLSQPAVRAAAMAASLVLMAGSGLFLATHSNVPGDRLRADIARANQRDHTPEAPRPPRRGDEIAQAPIRPAPSPDLSPAREPVPGRDQVAEERVPRTRPELAPLLVQLALSGIRGDGEDPGIPRREIRPGTQTVEIRLPLDPDVTAASFDVALRNAVSGEEIRRDKALAAQVVDGERVLRFTVPAARLAPGIYEVEVYGESPGEEGEREFLGRPSFEMEMP